MRNEIERDGKWNGGWGKELGFSGGGGSWGEGGNTKSLYL